ncbi:MAG: amino acid--tRNA ligase-related protein [Thermodesulfobacteriota bacterium]|nr:amino acid--tRNA ligase-related protein [Thermodesulfobacteriota bacterium]
MKNDTMSIIGQSLFGFQAALKQAGSSLEEYLDRYYYNKWMGETLYAAMALRTTFVNAMHQFLADEGLFNLERLQLSPVTDPLAHDVEHVPNIHYKGQLYVMTHSMIYAKFLACHNPKIKGIFVDSPNIRLEIESLDRKQRGKYLIDFTQMDVEVRRNRHIDLETYLKEPEKVKKVLSEDMEKGIDLFERLIIHSMTQLVEKNEDELKAMGVVVEVPKQPFPRFKCDESKKKYSRDYEIKLGEDTKYPFFWVTGLLRENYDLVYPYLRAEGKIPLSDVTSDMIYNYDICAKSTIRDTGKQTPALEILSGAVREWIYEAIVERLLDNGIIPVRPVIYDGNIKNIDELGGYGPFLMMAAKKDSQGESTFPETFGGGIGVERTLYAICRGPKLEKIDDITCFGKNPDSHQVYLF